MKWPQQHGGAECAHQPQGKRSFDAQTFTVSPHEQVHKKESSLLSSIKPQLPQDKKRSAFSKVSYGTRFFIRAGDKTFKPIPKPEKLSVRAHASVTKLVVH
ncbi:MAG: hypothetical protein DME22_07785 [Verrucomicrobia bacterium]|nr:MAG: hypothetical protein DME22_07785 [Verrucomicrobiota bacterium]